MAAKILPEIQGVDRSESRRVDRSESRRVDRSESRGVDRYGTEHLVNVQTCVCGRVWGRGIFFGGRYF